jgi:hypothetical protein
VNRAIRVAGSAFIGICLLAGSVFAQGTVQTVDKINLVPLVSGYRTSKIVGSAVMNEANEVLGTIDDLILTPGDTVPFAVFPSVAFSAWPPNWSSCRTVLQRWSISTSSCRAPPRIRSWLCRASNMPSEVTPPAACEKS